MKKRTIMLIVVSLSVLLVAFALFRKPPANEPQSTNPSSLTGTWTATGYTCTGLTPATQEVLIREEGDLVFATKVDGDECVGAGEVTWEGVRDAGEIVAIFHARPVGGELARYAATVTVTDDDTLVLSGPGLGIHTFTRIKE